MYHYVNDVGLCFGTCINVCFERIRLRVLYLVCSIRTCLCFCLRLPPDVGGNRDGSGSGSSLTYNPVTPLSCDCAKTLIKSCALAFHPVAGCALAVTDLGTACTVRFI